MKGLIIVAASQIRNYFNCRLANNNGHPTLDQYGIHLSACLQHWRIGMIVAELHSVCPEAGFHTKREPKNLFSQSQHRGYCGSE
jgi:hypothetical protein